MEYKIISGRCVEIRRVYMAARGGERKRRGTRRAGISSARKIRANEESSKKILARLINVNFGAGSGFLSLKYDDDHLPGSFGEAKAAAEKFMRRFRAAYRRMTGTNPKTILVNANWSPRKQRPARLHHHMLVPADGIELARRLWQGGGFAVECLDNRADHSELAGYLVDNLHDLPGEQHWHPSRNLDKPIFTEPVPVDDVEDLRPERGSVIKAHETTTDEDGHVTGSYLRCVLPAAPRVRGGQIVLGRQSRGAGSARRKEAHA